MECALDACGDMLPELLPAEITEQYALPKVGFAYRNVHFPPDQGNARSGAAAALLLKNFSFSPAPRSGCALKCNT